MTAPEHRWDIQNQPAVTEEDAWRVPKGASPWRIAGPTAVFLPIAMGKVFTAVQAGGSRADTALTIVAWVWGGSILLVLLVGLPIFIGVMMRSRHLGRVWGRENVFVAFNLLHFAAALRTGDPRTPMPARGFYSLVIEPDRLSAWVGARHPRKIAEIFPSEIESIDQSPTASAHHGVSVWLEREGQRFVMPVQPRRVWPIGTWYDRPERLMSFTERLRAIQQ